MGYFLGIDTSNYTTSCALYCSNSGEIISKKKLLPVKDGERGLRQSDAVFHHTKQLPLLMKELFKNKYEIEALAYSFAPRLKEGSYMPCFLVGESVGESISSAMCIPSYRTSHQIGHILAALYSCQKLEFLHSDDSFLAFHISGGTTDMLLCRSDKEKILDITEIGSSLDLKAGQCIDRIGVKMEMHFPCGAELEKLALKSCREFKIKPVLKDMNCCLSGLENKCLKLLSDGESREDTAKYCLDYICETIVLMCSNALKKYGQMPVVFAGGVMSNTLIRKKLEERFDGFFAQPQFSSDNAAGIAIYAAMRKGLI